MTIECRVALSPTPAFINRTLLLAASVREFYPDAIVRAYVGDTEGTTIEVIHAAWNTLIRADVLTYVTPRDECDEWKWTRSPFLAAMNDRFRRPKVEADHVLIMDADVICTGRFDEALESCVAGVMTHVPPMPRIGMLQLWRMFAGDDPQDEYLHSGAGIMCDADARSPWYANSGIVFLPRKRFEDMIDPYHGAIGWLRSTLTDTYWFDQLALGLAAAYAKAPVQALPLRYNFPNQDAFDQAYPVDLADCRFLHYLRTDTVDRDADFESVAAIQRFIARPGLVGSNALLQRRVGQLLNKVWPAEAYAAEDAPHA